MFQYIENGLCCRGLTFIEGGGCSKLVAINLNQGSDFNELQICVRVRVG